jgi:pimeloyl-ACP methyl ester carboxylesterase
MTQAILIGGTFLPGFGHRFYKTVARIWEAQILMLPRHGWPHLDWSQQRLIHSINELAPKGEPLVLIGHSQGGLHACLYAAHRPWVRVITAATPHHGSVAAYPLSPLWPSLRDMLPGSPFMRRYQAECLPLVAPRLLSLFWRNDPLVQPGNSPYVEGAKNHVIDTPLFSPDWLSGFSSHITDLFRAEVWQQLHHDHHPKPTEPR